MTFSHHTRGAMAQVLSAVSDHAWRDFVYKHLGLIKSRMPRPRVLLADAPPEVLHAMLVELVARNSVLRAAAPAKDVFDRGVADLQRWALHDGWVVEGEVLVRVTPMAEAVTGVSDKLVLELAVSGLDDDNAIRTAIDGSSRSFVSEPPDLNGSITKARIALETVGRRAAAQIAAKRNAAYPEDSWGKALQFLKAQDVIERQEEEILTKVYTFISQAAHFPKGLTEEEWARLSRTFALSSTYFLLQKYMVA